MGSVLLVTEKDDLSADLLTVSFQKRNITPLRFNAEDFPYSALLSWQSSRSLNLIPCAGEAFPAGQIRSVWYRRSSRADLPKHLSKGPVRDFIQAESSAFLEGLWETMDVFWMNKPSRVRQAENKLVQLELASALGMTIPRTIITNNPQTVRQFFRSAGPVVAKSVMVGGVPVKDHSWEIFTTPLATDEIQDDDSIRLSPCIYQERLRKAVDIRITAVGSKLFGAEIIIASGASENPDWRRVSARLLQYRRHKIPRAIASFCLTMMNRLGLTYGAFDFILDEQRRYYFLEINPSGQWGWIEHETNQPITSAIVQALLSGQPA